MDPVACLERMISALDDEDFDEAAAARDDLRGWFRRGGFGLSLTDGVRFKEACVRLDRARDA